MSKRRRQPQAFILDGHKKSRLHIELEPPPQPQRTATAGLLPAPAAIEHRYIGWGAVLGASLFLLLIIWVGLMLTDLVSHASSQSPVLGWFSLFLVMLIGLALLILAFREILALTQLEKLEKLHSKIAQALATANEPSAQQSMQEVANLYRKRTDMQWHVENWYTHRAHLGDAYGHIALAEHYLMEPLDQEAYRLISTATSRIAILTALIPVPALDIACTAFLNLRMLRQLCTLYGGRPAYISTLKLARMVMTHMAIAGSMAFSDTLLQNMLGKGLFGMLSARFGEGVVNAILTARIGLAAIDIIRPLPQPLQRKLTLSGFLYKLLPPIKQKNITKQVPHA